ncbi:hypothetical protein M407DRAFT_33358 [Tulasnella calospora MUT 4182]|uniref:PARP catalytic domain-containing protein n=1 Tax=Tulasnella calospora MUT 4182 TaxID=1051891 RepID=A0A0C3Q2H1_9AGAM|nr:hypothetical protein M407DRAFT_33358 [Tulasnella calospora MUT 4182]
MASRKPVIRWCKQCRKVPAYGTYDYCSRGCATAAAGANLGRDSSFSPAGFISNVWETIKSAEVVWPEDSPSTAYSVTCKNCRSHPSTPGFEFCSRKCGQEYARAHRSAPSSPMSNRPSGSHSSRMSSDSIPAGFTRSPIPPVDPKSSAARSSAECLMCRTVPKMSGSQFCSDGCKKNAHKEAPLLLEVYSWDPKFYDIANQFATTWKEESRPPPVMRVYKIVNSKKVEDAYEDYKKAVEKQGKFSARGKAPGNENRRWHGTERKCNIGDSPENLTPCNSSQCFVCCILRMSYDVKLSTTGWFGKGIYTTATSSGSNEYVGRSPPGSNCRAMFLNRVVVGNAYILNKQQESLKGPPKGFDSVIANADQSQGLAYDELVVYKNEAIRASWLVIYG